MSALEPLHLSAAWSTFVESDSALRTMYVGRGERPGSASVPIHVWSSAPTLFASHFAPHIAIVRRLVRAASASQTAVLVGQLGLFTNQLVADPPASLATLEECQSFGVSLGVPYMILPYLTTAAAGTLCERAGGAIALLPAEPYAYIDVPWASFDDYLASLPQKRRASVRTEVRRSDLCGIQFSAEDLIGQMPELAQYLTETERRHGGAVSHADVSDYLRRLGDHLGESVTVISARDARAELRGSCVAVEWFTELYAHKVGFDQASTRACALYFNLGYYRQIRHAIAKGLRRLNLGPGALDAKLLRGAQIETRWTAIWNLALDSRTFIPLRGWSRLQFARQAKTLRRFGLGLSEADAQLRAFASNEGAP